MVPENAPKLGKVSSMVGRMSGTSGGTSAGGTALAFSSRELELGRLG